MADFGTSTSRSLLYVRFLVTMVTVSSVYVRIVLVFCYLGVPGNVVPSFHRKLPDELNHWKIRSVTKPFRCEGYTLAISLAQHDTWSHARKLENMRCPWYGCVDFQYRPGYITDVMYTASTSAFGENRVEVRLSGQALDPTRLSGYAGYLRECAELWCLAASYSVCGHCANPQASRCNRMPNRQRTSDETAHFYRSQRIHLKCPAFFGWQCFGESER